MSVNNPYSSASDAYGSTAAATDQRMLEGRILMKAAMKMEVLAERLDKSEPVSREEIGEALEYNRKLWVVFASEAGNEDHPLPQNVKNDIASLSLFVFKRTIDILADTQPEKIRALIEINRNLAAGLMRTVPPPSEEQRPKQTPQQGKTDNLT